MIFRCLVLCVALMGSVALAQLRLSDAQLMAGLAGFNLKDSKLANGDHRRMGMSKDGGAMIELIGSAANVKKATLIIGIPNDSPQVVALNAGRILRFTANATPGWKSGGDWINSGLKKIANGDYSGSFTRVSGKNISMTSIQSGALIMLTIE